METVKICPRCGKPLGPAQLDGLCPECLLQAGMGTAAPGMPPGSHPGAEAHGFIPPKPADLAPLFPTLEILDLLGKGGMGAVYKARQRGLDRVVALKILPPEVGRDPAFAGRFEREARALARLSHPNIVTVHESGQNAGQYYFLMEFIDGVTLRDLLRDRKLTPRQAMEIVPRICEALQYAHDEGVVHRDIKPENILVDKKGRVKIADFGLAKLVGGPAGPPLTRSADVMGTPQYMAPEQFERPQEVDHRADIYSLGVVFYEMLTGELPLGRFSPPSNKVQVDVRLDEVVLRALEKEPARRYQQASQFKTQVETISTTAPPAFVAAPAGSGAGPAVATARGLSPIAAQMQAPAVALIVVGAINVVLATLSPLILPILLPMFHMAQSRGPGMMPKAYISLWAGVLPMIIIAGAWLSLVLGALNIAAGITMKRLQHYGFILTITVLGMLCSPTNLIGLAVGIWVLLTLSRKEVREAFAAEKNGGEATQAAGGTTANTQATTQKSSKGWLVPLIIVLALIVLIPLVLIGAYWLSSTPSRPTQIHLKQQEQTHTLHRQLMDQAGRALQGGRFAHSGMSVMTDQRLKTGKITAQNLTDRENPAAGVIEGGFDLRQDAAGTWHLEGWGALTGIATELRIIKEQTTPPR